MHTYLDVFTLILAIVLSVMGLKRGFIREFFRLSALIVGFLLAYLYYEDIQGLISFLSMPQQLSALFSFLTIFLFSFLIILVLGLFIRKITHLTLLGWLDRLLGLFLGMLKTVVIAWIACLSLSTIPSNHIRSDLDMSFTYRAYKALPHSLSLDGMEEMRRRVRNVVEDETKERIRRSKENLEVFRENLDSAKVANGIIN
ncbi:CvpA family protein [Chitinispirillales bacterium ANBcel5]|uniref:CvpA family protein n=1 Tax=Cellulosispirillum alkaliphilum TaxID=3039283 RepID=UPI002A57BB18|nr:CvpA family protein [Chitinispirillales bacterium ANBcel5]